MSNLLSDLDTTIEEAKDNTSEGGQDSHVLVPHVCAPPCQTTHHPDWLTGAHVVVVGVPALELGVLATLQDVLLALEVGVIIADPGPTLHADGVDAVHEATVLEVITVAEHLQLPPGEAFPLVKHDLKAQV